MKVVIQFYFVLMCLFLPHLAFAVNGGMVVTTEIEGSTYVLLVQSHKHDYYEFPGGHIEKGQDLVSSSVAEETLYEAALRETMEETRGYLGRWQLEQMSSPQQMIAIGKFRLFLAKLPFFSLNELRKIKIPKGKKWSPMHEIVDYAWVKVTEFANKEPIMTLDGRQIELHPIASNVIYSGRIQGWFN